MKRLESLESVNTHAHNDSYLVSNNIQEKSKLCVN